MCDWHKSITTTGKQPKSTFPTNISALSDLEADTRDETLKKCDSEILKTLLPFQTISTIKIHGNNQDFLFSDVNFKGRHQLKNVFS